MDEPISHRDKYITAVSWQVGFDAQERDREAQRKPARPGGPGSPPAFSPIKKLGAFPMSYTQRQAQEARDRDSAR